MLHRRYAAHLHDRHLQLLAGVEVGLDLLRQLLSVVGARGQLQVVLGVARLSHQGHLGRAGRGAGTSINACLHADSPECPGG